METLAFAHLDHSIVAADLHERIVIRLKDVDLGDQLPNLESTYCSFSIGPASSIKSPRIRAQVKLHRGGAEKVLGIGPLSPQESWVLRMKFYRKSKMHFGKHRVAEGIVSAPCPMRHFTLRLQGEETILGGASVEILRLLPGNARKPLALAICASLRCSGSDQRTAELCAGVKELVSTGVSNISGGSDAGLKLLAAMASLGCQGEVESLLDAGVLPNAAAVHVADSAGHPMIAYSILHRMSLAGVVSCCDNVERVSAELWWSLQHNLPGLVDWIHSFNPNAIDALLHQEATVTEAAHNAKAWNLLQCLVVRYQQPLPAPACQIFDAALSAGHVALAHACLPYLENISDIECALRSCLGYGNDKMHCNVRRAPTAMIRDTLEAHWRLRSSLEGDSLYEGPAILDLQHANTSMLEDPEECPICFEPLCKVGAAALLNDFGLRICPHFVCQGCAAHVQDEVQSRRFTTETVCPLCRAVFSATNRLPDPTVDPCAFFRLACMPDHRGSPSESHLGSNCCMHSSSDASHLDDASLKLSGKAAFSALCALLPVNPKSFETLFDITLWPTWTRGDADGVLSEDDFLAPHGMLAWLSDHILELKIDKELGTPPDLASDGSGWFEYFDYDDDGLLTQNEVLRGIAKTMDVSSLASPTTPGGSSRGAGVKILRELIEPIWDASHWREGVPLTDFVGPSGLGQKILKLLPQTSQPQSSQGRRSGVNEALEKARLFDLRERESYRKSRASPVVHKPLPSGQDIDDVVEELEHMLRLIAPTTEEQQDTQSEPSSGDHHVRNDTGDSNSGSSDFEDTRPEMDALSDLLDFIDLTDGDAIPLTVLRNAGIGGA